MVEMIVIFTFEYSHVAAVMSQKKRYLQAVESVFKGWPALVMAVDNCFGGPNSVEKAEWMIEVTGEYVLDNWPGEYEVIV